MHATVGPIEAMAISGETSRAVRHRARRRRHSHQSLVLPPVPAAASAAALRKEEVLLPLYTSTPATATRGGESKRETEASKIDQLQQMLAGFDVESTPDRSIVLAIRSLLPSSVSDERIWRLAWVYCSTPPTAGTLAYEILLSVAKLDHIPKHAMANVVTDDIQKFLSRPLERSIYKVPWVSVLCVLSQPRSSSAIDILGALTAGYGWNGRTEYVATYPITSRPIERLLQHLQFKSCQVFMTLLFRHALMPLFRNGIELYNAGGIAACICYARAARAVGMVPFVPTHVMQPQASEHAWSEVTADMCAYLHSRAAQRGYFEMRFL